MHMERERKLVYREGEKNEVDKRGEGKEKAAFNRERV